MRFRLTRDTKRSPAFKIIITTTIITIIPKPREEGSKEGRKEGKRVEDRRYSVAGTCAKHV